MPTGAVAPELAFVSVGEVASATGGVAATEGACGAVAGATAGALTAAGGLLAVAAASGDDHVACTARGVKQSDCRRPLFPKALLGPDDALCEVEQAVLLLQATRHLTPGPPQHTTASLRMCVYTGRRTAGCAGAATTVGLLSCPAAATGAGPTGAGAA